MEFRYGVLDFCRHAGSYVGARTKQPAHMKEKKRTPSRLGFVTFVNQPIDLLRGNVRGHPQETLCRVRSPILLVSFEYEQRANRLVEALVGQSDAKFLLLCWMENFEINHSEGLFWFEGTMD